MAQKRITIKETTKEPWASAQNVARVINDRPEVVAATRQRVLEAITRPGSLPGAFAPSHLSHTTHIGRVTDGLQYRRSQAVCSRQPAERMAQAASLIRASVWCAGYERRLAGRLN